MTPRQAISQSWTDHLTENPIGLGFDVATTEKDTSNPSSLAVMQRASGLYVIRLLLAWKTLDPKIANAILDVVLGDLFALERRPRRLCIDASSETYFAKDVQTRLRGRVPVEMVKSGEKIEWKGAEYNYKTLLGNLYVCLFEDNLIAIPPAKWISDDHRLVKRDRGTFVADLGDNGEHGDTFDGGKLAYWALENGRGPFTAHAVSVGGLAKPKANAQRPHGRLKAWFGRSQSIRST